MKSHCIGSALAVLMLGFCAFTGVMILASALGSIFTGPFVPGEFILKGIAGLVFVGMGGGGLYALYGHSVLYPLWQKRQFERYAERPWERKQAWRTGRIPYRKPSPALFLWIFALGWNAGVGTVLWGNRDLIVAQAREDWLSVLPAALFPLIGVGVLCGAVGATFGGRTTRRAHFVMASVPAWIGGTLEGTVETRIPAAMKGIAKLELSCGIGEPVVAEVPPERLIERPKAVAIPVALKIPPDAPPTDELDTDRKILWTLEAKMKVDGRRKDELAAVFSVPVYRRGSDAENKILPAETPPLS